MKRLIYVPLILCLVLLAACTSGDDDPPPVTPLSSPTLAPIPWVRPQAAISQENARIQLSGTMLAHQATVNDVAFTLSGSRLASVAADNSVIVWNLANGQSLFEQGEVSARHVFFGPNDETLITITPAGFTRVWAMNIAPPRELEELVSFMAIDQDIRTLVQSPDRSLLAFGTETGQVRIWRVPEGQLMAEIQASGNVIENMEFSPDSRYLATLGKDWTARVWSVPDGELVYDLINQVESEISRIPVTLAWSANADRLALGYTTGVEVWDMSTGGARYMINTAENMVSSALQFSPDGSLLAGCGRQPRIELWNAATGSTAAGLPLPTSICNKLAFSPDGTLLFATPVPGRDALLWNLQPLLAGSSDGQVMLGQANRDSMHLLPGTVFFDFEWSPDGRFIVLLDELGPMYALTASISPAS